MVSIIAQALLAVIRLMEIAVFAVVLMSWVPQAQGTKFAQILRMLTDPILVPIREFTQRMMGGGGAFMFDFSPLIAIILINVLESIVKGFAYPR